MAKLGAWPNWLLGLSELYLREPKADAYLMVQDDVTFAGGLRKYLEETLWPDKRLGVVSLHTASHQDRGDLQGYYASDCGWAAWGAQAYVLPNASARALLAHPRIINHRHRGPRDGLANVDSIIGKWCKDSGLAYYFHTPSLTQHTGETFYPLGQRHASRAGVARQPSSIRRRRANKTMAKQKPIVLIVYADTGPALGHLAEEARDLRAALRDSGVCDPEVVPAARSSDLIAELQSKALRDRVAVIHYAGHANGQGVFLRGADGSRDQEMAHIDGLASIIAQQRNLRLVFLNGCSSQGQVDALRSCGVPAVIATTRGIDDAVAKDFARAFYSSLVSDNSLSTAFDTAEATIQTASGSSFRGALSDAFDDELEIEARWPWRLHGDRDDLAWRLHDSYLHVAASQWDPKAHPLDTTSPYRGLRRFEEEHSGVFYGRDAETDALLAAANASHLVMVLGPSGSGKSSVVRAGVIPRWRKEGGQGARTFVITPDVDPFDSLYVGLRAAGLSASGAAVARQPSPDVFTAAADALQEPGDRWFILIDQFEELFTRVPDTPEGEAARAAFIDSLVDLAQNGTGSVRVALAMRDDFFPSLGAYPELAAITDANLQRIGPIDEEGLREVIERPAAEHGVGFADRLTDRIIADIGGRTGMLPLLQYTLDELWARADFDHKEIGFGAYEAINGVRGALTGKVEELYAGLDGDGQVALRRIILRLVDIGESAGAAVAVSRRAGREEFAKGDSDLLARLVTDEKLLVSSGDRGVELVHEALINSWPRFAGWIEEGREVIALRNRLREDAERWKRAAAAHGDARADEELWSKGRLGRVLELQEAGQFDLILGGLGEQESDFVETSRRSATRAERRRRRTRRLVLTIVSILGIAALIAGAVAIVKGKEAEANGEEAIRQGEEAKKQSLQAQKNFNRTLFIQGTEKAETFQHDQGAAYLAHALRMEPDNLQVRRRLYGILRSSQLVPIVESVELPGEALALELSPDGQTAAVADDSGSISIWRFDEGRLERTGATLAAGSRVTQLSFSNDGELLAAACDRVAKTWRVSDGQLLREVQHNSEVLTAGFSADASRLYSAAAREENEAPDFAVTELASGRKLSLTPLPFSNSTSRRGGAKVSPGGEYASYERFIIQLNGPEPLLVKNAPTNIEAISFSPTGIYGLGTVRVPPENEYDSPAETVIGFEIPSMRLCGEPATIPPFDFEGGYIDVYHSPTGDAAIGIIGYNEETDGSGRARTLFESWGDGAFHLDREMPEASYFFSETGKHLGVSGELGMRIQQTQNGTILSQQLVHSGTIVSARFTTGDRFVLTIASRDQRLRVWDTRRLHTLPHEFPNNTLIEIYGNLPFMDLTYGDYQPEEFKNLFTPGVAIPGHVIAASKNRQFAVVSLADEAKLRVLRAPSGELHGESVPKLGYDALITNDGRHLIVGMWRDQTAHVWNLQTGDSIRLRPRPKTSSRSGVFLSLSPDEKLLLVQINESGEGAPAIGGGRVFRLEDGTPVTEWLAGGTNAWHEHPLREDRPYLFSEDSPEILGYDADDRAVIRWKLDDAELSSSAIVALAEIAGGWRFDDKSAGIRRIPEQERIEGWRQLVADGTAGKIWPTGGPPPPTKPKIPWDFGEFLRVWVQSGSSGSRLHQSEFFAPKGRALPRRYRPHPRGDPARLRSLRRPLSPPPLRTHRTPGHRALRRRQRSGTRQPALPSRRRERRLADGGIDSRRVHRLHGFGVADHLRPAP